MIREAERVFKDTGIKITKDSRPYLGAPIWSSEYAANYMLGRVDKWIMEVMPLAKIASTQPQAAFQH